MKDFLVFERTAGEEYFSPRPGVEHTMESERTLLGFTCVGSVRARTADAAVMAVVGITRRLSRYAAIEATIIDLVSGTPDQEGEERPLLNP